MTWPAKNVILFCINIFTATTCSVVFAMTIYTLFCRKSHSAMMGMTSKASLWITFASICCHFTLSMIDPLLFYFYEVFDDEAISNAVYYAWMSTYAICRVSIYVVYVHRLRHVFQDSSFKYPAVTYVLLAMACTLAVSSIAVSLSGVDSLDVSGGSTEQFLLAMLSFFVFMIMDFLVIISLCLMFVTPFKQLIAMIGNHTRVTITSVVSREAIRDVEKFDENENSAGRTQTSAMSEMNQLRVFHAATKISLLVIVSLSSSIVYQSMWVLSLSLEHRYEALYAFTYSWGMDNVTNIVCLFLSYGASHSKYQWLCVDGLRLHWCWARCVFSMG